MGIRMGKNGRILSSYFSKVQGGRAGLLIDIKFNIAIWFDMAPVDTIIVDMKISIRYDSDINLSIRYYIDILDQFFSHENSRAK